MRAGTSKGLFFRQEDLPEDRLLWDPILLAAMGSPDPNGRQLNGMGGGQSTQSKVAIVSVSEHPDADVDYLFAQSELDKEAKTDPSPDRRRQGGLLGQLR
jgi:2-methylaconitate cis-trans-isomerase PrpF